MERLLNGEKAGCNMRGCDELSDDRNSTDKDVNKKLKEGGK